MMATIKRFSLVAIFLSASVMQSLAATPSENNNREIKLKAAYLYNFLRFIDWPEKQHQSKLCVYGSVKEYEEVFISLPGQVKSGLSIQIKNLQKNSDVQHLQDCQIVYFTRFSSDNPGKILEQLANSDSLTVGESELFLDQGGMINFLLVDDKVKFEINNRAVKNAGLKISSKVLRLAVRVQD